MSTGTFLPVLNEVEKASIRERQPLPEHYLGLSDEAFDWDTLSCVRTLYERVAS